MSLFYLHTWSSVPGNPEGQVRSSENKPFVNHLEMDPREVLHKQNVMNCSPCQKWTIHNVPLNGTNWSSCQTLCTLMSISLVRKKKKKITVLLNDIIFRVKGDRINSQLPSRQHPSRWSLEGALWIDALDFPNWERLAYCSENILHQCCKTNYLKQ